MSLRNRGPRHRRSDLGDTSRLWNAETTARCFNADDEVGIDSRNAISTLHLHDTFGRAAQCVKATLDMGITSFDGSVAAWAAALASTPGKRAAGNISTEAVRTVHAAGYTTGVIRDSLESAAALQ